jgi:DNA-binding winged helix-turn-helix (wHTH) protein
VVQESSLAQAILKLRRSLKEGFGDGEIIQTISKRGYRLTVAVAVAVTVEDTVTRQRTADELAVLSQLSAVDNTANEALQMDRSAARNCRLILMAGLVVTGVALALALALALPWFR